MSRIDYLKSQIVAGRDLEKTMPVGSPARVHLEKQRAEFEQELDQWQAELRKPQPTPQEPSQLVETLVSQLEIVGLKPTHREWKFHPERKWRFDLVWVSFKVAVEVHGGIHSGGRHTRGAGFERDREKMNEAALMGWLVLEVTGDQIRSGQALAWVEKALEVRGGD